MIAQGLADSLASPAVIAVLATVGFALLWLLAREVRRIPAELMTLMATAFLDMFGLFLVLPLVPYYVKRMVGDGVDVAGITFDVGTVQGVVVSAFTVAQLLSAPLWGRFSDRFGRRPALLIALGASAVAYLIFGFADSLGMLLLSRVMQGAGGGTVGVIHAYVGDSAAPEQRVRALGWLSASTNLGVAMGPALSILVMHLAGSTGPAVADAAQISAAEAERLGGQAWTGIAAAAMCLLNMAFAARYLRESNTQTGAAVGHARTSTIAALRLVVQRAGEPAARLIWIYTIAMAALQGSMSMLALFLQGQHGIGPGEIGFVFMWIGATSVFARVLLLGRLVDRLGESRLSRLGIALLCIGLAGLPLAGSLPAVAAAITLLPLGTAFTFPCVTGMLSRVVPATERGLYMGTQQTFGGIARVVAPLCYGWSFDHLGAASPYWFASGLVLLALPVGLGLDHLFARRPAG